MVLYILSMSYLLDDFDNNILTTDEDTNNICLCIDNIKKTQTREYVSDFLGYDLIKKNNNYKLNLVLNNDILNKLEVDFSYYYNINTKHYYLEYNKPIYLNEESGTLLFLIKNKTCIIKRIAFNYKLNDPEFNTDIIKIISHNYILYVYTKRPNKQSLFHIYKIIFTLEN